MQKIYKLLRNNQESGPFSLEALKFQGLKSFDLIWIEGKSAGWQYPSEIDELDEIIEISAKHPKEKIEYSKIIVIPPSRITHNQSFTEESVLKTDDQNLEVKKELFNQKAEALRKKAFASTFDQGNDATIESEVKYCKSLNDLKQDYASWLSQQKKKAHQPNKKIWAVAGATILIIVLAGILFFPGKDKIDNLTGFKEIPDTKLLPDANSSILQTAKTEENDPLVNTRSKEKSSSSKRNAPGNKAAKKNIDKKENPAKKKVSPITTSANKSYSLPQLVKVKGRYKHLGYGVSNPEITLINNSPEILHVVAVNVLYYNADGSLAGKETIYFNELDAHSTSILKAPSHPGAEEVRFQLGLISASRGGLFYAMP